MDESNWLLGNIKHAGFYRVNYDTHNWNLLIKELNEGDHELIDVISRAQLLDDSFNLGKAEYIDQTIFLRVAGYLRRETDGIPFQAASDGLNYIGNMLVSNYTSHKKFQV